MLASKREIRSQIVPQEFKGDAQVVPEHDAVLHSDGVVGILRVLVQQVLKDRQLLQPLTVMTGAHITLFLTL